MIAAPPSEATWYIHPRYILTKFEGNLASSFGEDENEIVNGGRMPDERWMPGGCWNGMSNGVQSHKLSFLYTTGELKMIFHKYIMEI